MQVSVEKISSVERRLTITVPASDVEAAFAKQIDRFAKNANIKGFRPGKAPMSHIQQRFGDDARKEALSDVIQYSLYKAITDEKLQPVSSPRIEPKSVLANQPLEYVASFEVLPDVEKINFSMDSIEKLDVTVSEEDVGHVITQLRKQYTKWKSVERPIQDKDRVVVDYYAIFEGVADTENKIEGFSLEIGSKVMLPGFEDALIGAKAGDELNVKLAFPADFTVPERAGKPVEFVVQIKQVFEAEAPEINEAFIKRLGISSGTEADLKKQISDSLTQERDRVVKEKLKEQVFRHLLEQNPIEIPASLVEKEAASIHDEVYSQQHDHNHHDHSEEELSRFKEIATKRVTLGLLIAEYAKAQSIKVDQDRVGKRILEIAAVYENPAEVAKWLMTDERRSGVEAQVLEDQVLDNLMDGIAVNTKTMTYAEVKGIRI